MTQVKLPLVQESSRFSALNGIRVLDLSTSVAGPYGCQILADFGAEVVKIEKPNGGDDSRAWGPPFLDDQSLWYLSVNRNKSSVVIDMTKVKGQELLHRLAKEADIVVTNFLPRLQTKLQVDYETLKLINPQLIHISLTGFGLEGARSSFPCYDLIAEGYSGVMDMTGEIDQDPQKVGTPAADLLAGMDLALAAMAAIIQRNQDGKGHSVDIAMIDSMTRFMAPRLSSYLGSGVLPRRDGAKESVIAIYQVFKTADELITLGLGNDAIWKRFWTILGEESFITDPKYLSNTDRRACRSELVQEIQKRLLTQRRSYWLELFQNSGIPSGPINRLDQIAADPEMHARGMFYEVEREGKRIPQIGFGIRIDRTSSYCEKPPPRLAEDTQAIFEKWLGLSKEDISQFAKDQVIHIFKP